jgi:hypothetical protein
VHQHKVSPGHAARTLIRFEQDMFPWVGRTPIDALSAPELLAVLRRVESRGAIETTHPIKDACGQVFRDGVASGICERDHAADLRDALKPVNVKHMATVLPPTPMHHTMRDKLVAAIQACEELRDRALVQFAQRSGLLSELWS